jgi:hypothetical protein
MAMRPMTNKQNNPQRMAQVKDKGPNRREVLAGAAAMGIAALIPVPVARPEFVAAYAEFLEARAAYDQAREAAYIARPRIMARVRKTDISAFFKSNEVRMRARTRSLARVAAGRVYVPEAANDAEAAMQDDVLSICEAELSEGDGLRKSFPPSRRA